MTTSNVGYALKCELSLKSNSLLTEPSRFQNKNQLPIEKPNLPPTAGYSTNLKANRAANITKSKISDIEDIENILTLKLIEAVPNQKKTKAEFPPRNWIKKSDFYKEKSD